MQDLIRKIAELERQIESMRTIEIPGNWTSYTPTPSTFTDQSFSNVTATGRYCIIGKLCSFVVNVEFDLSGATGSWNRIYISFPKTAINTTMQHVFTGWGYNGTNIKAQTGYLYDTSKMLVRPSDGINWVSGTSLYIKLSGIYEIE